MTVRGGHDTFFLRENNVKKTDHAQKWRIYGRTYFYRG